MRSRRSGVACVLAATTLGLAACTSGAAPVVATDPAPSSVAPTTATPTPTPSVSVAPAVVSLSGKPGSAGKPVIAVKIDNTSSARPQSGLNAADIVYVEQVEAGITRLMAVFQSEMPSRIGPVRSGRESDLEILAPYGKVALAYSGAQAGVERLIRASPQVTVMEDHGSFFFRDHGRRMPYNLYLDPAKLLKAKPRIATANDIGLHFTAEPPAGGKNVRALTAQVSNSVTIGFSYDAKNRRWLQSQSGAPISVASGERVWTTNVIVQEVSIARSRFHDVNGVYTPLTRTVGTGKFRMLRPDGTMTTGTWKRAKATAPTVFTDAKGTEVLAAPGRTWIVFAPKGAGVDVR